MKKEGTNSVCSECGGEYYVPPAARGKRRTCSMECRSTEQSRRQTRAPELRLWEKVRKTDTCWLWTGAMLKTGYGSIRIDGKAMRAHRVAYELEKGEIPDGMLLRHTCDNRECVNPDHLIPGTSKDNTNDALVRGRHVCGDKHFKAKLSNHAVTAIRAAFDAGVPGRFLAKQFGVTESMISQIKNGNKRRLG